MFTRPWMRFGANCLALAGVAACGQESSQGEARVADDPAGTVEVGVAPGIPGVVAEGTPIRFVGEEFETSTLEGPVALRDGGVIFSERDTGRTWKIGPDETVSILLENPLTGPLGLGFDSEGRLIAVQTQPAERTRIAVIFPNDRREVLADNFEGQPLGRPNDLVVDQKDGVYFTAPATTDTQVESGYPRAEARVYYLPSGGEPIRIADNIGRPNGIQLSPDGRTLYVNDSAGEYMLAFDVQPDGTVRNRRDFARYVGVDRTGAEPLWANANGLAVDEDGRIYSVTRSGVQVFDTRGEHLGTVPAQRGAENLAFGGPDKGVLYIVGGGVVTRVQMLARGFSGRPK